MIVWRDRDTGKASEIPPMEVPIMIVSMEYKGGLTIVYAELAKEEA